MKEQCIRHRKTAYCHHIYAVGRMGSPAMMMVSYDDGESFVSSFLHEQVQMLFDIEMGTPTEAVRKVYF